MSEKMREALKEAINLRIEFWRNGDYDDDMMSDDQIIAKDHYASRWQSALRTHENGGQESEAGAVKAFRHKDTGEIRYALSTPPHDETEWEDVYISTAPPSAPAIEYAAIIRAAAAVACPGRTIFDTEKAILALIPQDGRTQLEEFGMKVAEAVNKEFGAAKFHAHELRAIVIGVPPLNSESVRGEGE